jgi:hypothetical protein
MRAYHNLKLDKMAVQIKKMAVKPKNDYHLLSFTIKTCLLVPTKWQLQRMQPLLSLLTFYLITLLTTNRNFASLCFPNMM